MKMSANELLKFFNDIKNDIDNIDNNDYKNFLNTISIVDLEIVYIKINSQISFIFDTINKECLDILEYISIILEN